MPVRALKPERPNDKFIARLGCGNKQNARQGIETYIVVVLLQHAFRGNKQNARQGIETLRFKAIHANKVTRGNKQNARQGIETLAARLARVMR